MRLAGYDGKEIHKKPSDLPQYPNMRLSGYEGKFDCINIFGGDDGFWLGDRDKNDFGGKSGDDDWEWDIEEVS
jgi:hypothetical protein